MLKLIILIALLVLLLIAKAFNNYTLDTHAEHTTSHKGNLTRSLPDVQVAYIYPKRTLSQTLTHTRRLKEALKHNPPRKEAHANYTVREWKRNDMLYQSLRSTATA